MRRRHEHSASVTAVAGVTAAVLCCAFGPAILAAVAGLSALAIGGLAGGIAVACAAAIAVALRRGRAR